MPNLPPRFGQELHMTASRPMSALVDGQRVRLEVKLEDGSELFLWLTKDQFQVSLELLSAAARNLGVPWPNATKP